MFEPAAVRIVCIALLVLGALFGGAGAALHIRGLRLAEAVADGAGQTEASCLAAARRVGGEVAPTADGLRLTMADTADQRTALTDATGLLAFCPDMELAYFCMGKACGSDGKVAMRMELRRSGS
ncbi:hypothetical protein J2847_002288 [Azospirillum agricola]|uniref:hypothetical protein n=1 Tax=Azospirillum agricola TaxID=1720247 RepID=UPI001AE5135D|nr:hypothetical protein [Azospirillum agricola]MBP2228996.1 hypothetical protein [Azospirillum agricola]